MILKEFLGRITGFPEDARVILGDFWRDVDQVIYHPEINTVSISTAQDPKYNKVFDEESSLDGHYRLKAFTRDNSGFKKAFSLLKELHKLFPDENLNLYIDKKQNEYVVTLESPKKLDEVHRFLDWHGGVDSGVDDDSTSDS